MQIDMCERIADNQAGPSLISAPNSPPPPASNSQKCFSHCGPYVGYLVVNLFLYICLLEKVCDCRLYVTVLVLKFWNPSVKIEGGGGKEGTISEKLL